MWTFFFALALFFHFQQGVESATLLDAFYKHRRAKEIAYNNNHIGIVGPVTLDAEARRPGHFVQMDAEDDYFALRPHELPTRTSAKLVNLLNGNEHLQMLGFHR
ncbi:unnamed protein product [Caenorhabditis auriculariae]|uniref:Peptidase M12B propeptide domain-containing protein n=1 Tax=Caenorhabditis auriculariae TaxID=2777116 RepID=A0A8S1HQM6_9PELO|nr:unnamed protein product [Caenorhabditis auriculariae]